jgi:hypothetical protein
MPGASAQSLNAQTARAGKKVQDLKIRKVLADQIENRPFNLVRRGPDIQSLQWSQASASGLSSNDSHLFFNTLKKSPKKTK